jgi:hypothetical protein
LLMSLAMCLWVMEHSFKNLEKLEKQTKAILSSWASSSTTTPMAKTVNPQTKQLEKKINPNHSAYRNVQDPRGEYAWLFGKAR